MWRAESGRPRGQRDSTACGERSGARPEADQLRQKGLLISTAISDRLRPISCRVRASRLASSARWRLRSAQDSIRFTTVKAAARHLSFTKAAQELHVTQAAISHQVKALEERLSVQMFRRMNRALLLTDEGQAYLPAVREAFYIIDAATARLLERDRAGTLVVSCMASFAAAWLVRPLGRFRTKHPELDVRVDPTLALVDFMREDIDIAVRYGRGDWSGVVSERFMTEDIVAVCSPELLAGTHPLRKSEDLRHHTLLHDDGHADWRRWLLAMASTPRAA